MHFSAVKNDLYFAAILNTLHRSFQNGSENHYISIIWDKFKTKNENEWLFHVCEVWSQLNLFQDFSSASSSHLISLILLHEKPHFNRALEFSRISKK